jgi:hypothetical protein
VSRSQRWWRDFRAQLGLVVVGAVVLRLVAVLTWSRDLTTEGDQNIYWREGQDLANWFGFVYRNNFGERVPTAVHPPLYSTYLGVVSFLGGHGPTAMKLASAVFGGLTVLVVGLAARRIAGHRVGIIAAVLCAIYPNIWINDVQIQSETVYAFTIALMILAAYRVRDDPSYANGEFLGLAIALAALGRAEALAFFILLAVPLILWRGRKPSSVNPASQHEPLDEVGQAEAPAFWTRADNGMGARLRVLGVVFLVGGIVLAPWVVRNLATFQKPTVMSSGAGFVLEISNCDQTYGLAVPTDANGNVIGDADTYLGYWSPQCDRTAWPAGDESVVEQAKRQTGLDYMQAHEAQLPKVLAARVGRIWDVWRPGQSYDFNVFFERRGQAPTRWGMIQYYAMLPFGLLGLVNLWRRRITTIPFVAIAISVTLTAAVSFGITRYRVGADVALCIVAAVGIDAVVRWFNMRRADEELEIDGGSATAEPVGATA